MGGTHDSETGRLLRPLVPHRREEDEAGADGRLEDAEKDALDDEALVGRADHREADYNAPEQDKDAEGLDGVDALQKQREWKNGGDVAPVETGASCRVSEGRNNLLSRRRVDVGC